MKVNKYQPHVLVLPEDDANRQIANGFLLDPAVLAHRIDVREVAGGSFQVLERFKSDHIRSMGKYANRLMVLLIDCDGNADRLDKAKGQVPNDLKERVFVIGARTKPEHLKAALGSYETIGKALAQDCRDGTDTTWSHALLRHNAEEVARLRDRVRPILFEGS